MKIEVHNLEAVRLELEHISDLIKDGYTVGTDWSIEGEDEAEPKVEFDESDEYEEMFVPDRDV